MGVLGDLTDLVRGRKDKSLKLDDILLMLKFVYRASVGGFVPEGRWRYSWMSWWP